MSLRTILPPTSSFSVIILFTLWSHHADETATDIFPHALQVLCIGSDDCVGGGAVSVDVFDKDLRHI